MRFKFEIVIPYDNAWGLKDSFGNWNGIIGLLEREEADVGLSHLDITASRKEVVDFSFPYDVADETFARNFRNHFQYMQHLFNHSILMFGYTFLLHISFRL